MYFLANLIGFDFEGLQAVLRWIVLVICFLSAGLLLGYKRNGAKFRLLPSILAYAMMLGLVSDPIFDFTGNSKPIDFTEVLGLSYLLAIFIAHKGNIMGAFKGGQMPKIFTFWRKNNETNQKKDQ